MTRSDTVYAYAGKILRINLSNGAVTTEPTARYAREWMGASGIAVKILYDELGSWVTPYEPANKLVFGAGALLGTPAPGACKLNASTLGPMTGGWATGCSDSYVGGQLKCAGFDTVVIEGKAQTPVYLWIADGKVEIRDAAFLWGKTTWETLDLLRTRLDDPKLHIISIGPGRRASGSGCLHHPGQGPGLRPLRHRGGDGRKKFESRGGQGHRRDPGCRSGPVHGNRGQGSPAV